MNAHKMKAAIERVRRSAVPISVAQETTAGLPDRILQDCADKAAAACTPLFRQFIVQNMRQRGIQSSGLEQAIREGLAVFHRRRMAIRFRLNASTNPYPRRRGGVWMVAASQDAGRVCGLKHVVAARAKRSIKAGVATAKTFAEIRQRHNGRMIVREAIDVSRVSVVPGKHFFQLSASQSQTIQDAFKRHFAGLTEKARNGTWRWSR